MNNYRVEVVVINVRADTETAAWEQVEAELKDCTALDFEMVSVEEDRALEEIDPRYDRGEGVCPDWEDAVAWRQDREG